MKNSLLLIIATIIGLFFGGVVGMVIGTPIASVFNHNLKEELVGSFVYLFSGIGCILAWARWAQIDNLYAPIPRYIGASIGFGVAFGAIAQLKGNDVLFWSTTGILVSIPSSYFLNKWLQVLCERISPHQPEQDSFYKDPDE